MKKIFYLILLTASLMWSIEIDVDLLENRVRKDPQDISNRVILAKYYLQNSEFQTAQYYLSEILKLDPKNSIALKLQKETAKGLELQEYLPKTNLQNPYEIEKALQTLLYANQYNRFLEIYTLLEKLDIPMTPQTNLMAIECYLEIDNIKKAKALLHAKELPQDEKLFAIKTYLLAKEGKLVQVRNNLQKLKALSPTSRLLPKITQIVQEHESAITTKLAKTLTKENSFQKLQEYVYLLNKQGKKKEAIAAAKKFVKKYPNNMDAKLLLVKLYYWNGDLESAFHKIYAFRKRDTKTLKLYTNILYEKGDYKHALVYLPEIVASATGKERYNLKKRLAFAYAYTGKKHKADLLFHQLLQQNPNDHEILQFQQEYQKQTLLTKAITHHKAKEYPQALDYYRRYYKVTEDPKIAKEIAEIYYFAYKKYHEPLPYYKRYLANYPNDQLIRFHYASALEKIKHYHEAAKEFAKITSCNDPKLCYLARYHQSYNLMQTQNESDWLQARSILKQLVTDLSGTSAGTYSDLKRFAASLLKTALGEVQKPTYYKDIVLTEGAKKELDQKSVFANVNIVTTTKPSLEELLDISRTKSAAKPTLQLQTEYVHDSEVRYRNYQLMVANLITANGIRYGVSAQKYIFDYINKKQEKGKGFFLHIGKNKLQFSLGVKEFKNFNMLIPKLTWAPVYGIHNFYFDLYYQNGVFANYRNCMIQNQTDVLHIGINDRILMDNLDFTEINLNLNAYEDNNINIYASLFYPIYSFNMFGLEHKLIFNENIDYNSKTKVCYMPTSLYDSTYLIYNPKVTFYRGSMEVRLGKGYSFNNRENVSSYTLKGDYKIDNLASVELNCERVQSSFTLDDIDYCTFNIIQEW